MLMTALTLTLTTFMVAALSGLGLSGQGTTLRQFKQLKFCGV